MGIYEGAQEMVVRPHFHNVDITWVADCYDTGFGSGTLYLCAVLMKLSIKKAI